MFSPEEVTKAVQNVLNADITIPEGHKVAFVTVANQNGLQTAIAAKINDTWRVQGDIGFHPNNKDWEYGITVQATW